MAFPPPFVLAITGSSLSAGKLAGVPNLWHAQLEHDLRLQPEAVGRIIIYRMGHGGWTSQDVLNEAPGLAVLRPTHIIADIDINDCVVSGGVPVYDRPTKIAHQLSLISAWKTNNPNVDITFQTMNPVSTSGTALRPNLSSYYGDTVATATAQGSALINSLDNYPGWISPMPDWMSHQFDGLHPNWFAVERYLYRNVLFLMRQKMAAWWGLAAPVAPVYPADPDINYLIVAGGGGGGDGCGGGGGNGDVLRGLDYAAALIGTITVGAAGVAAAGQPGTSGGDSILGLYRALGGGGGGLYTANLVSSLGKDGGSGGGGGTNTSSIAHSGGIPTGLGFPGGFSDLTANGGAGGGGGCSTPATSGSGVNGGLGGTGWQSDVPGDSQALGGGGSGGSLSGARAAYPLGGGPTCFGGGGRGGGAGAGVGAGDNGGAGAVWIWYPGGARFTGGVITVSGGFTVHKFTASSALVPITGAGQFDFTDPNQSGEQTLM